MSPLSVFVTVGATISQKLKLFSLFCSFSKVCFQFDIFGKMMFKLKHHTGSRFTAIASHIQGNSLSLKYSLVKTSLQVFVHGGKRVLALHIRSYQRLPNKRQQRNHFLILCLSSCSSCLKIDFNELSSVENQIYHGLTF